MFYVVGNRFPKLYMMQVDQMKFILVVLCS